MTVEYLAVAQMPQRWSRRLRGTLLRRTYGLPRAWHAVPANGSTALALCGFRYTREPHRTWKQTMIPRRCPKCQSLIDEAEASIPAASPLWAVPCSPESTEHLTVPNSMNSIPVEAREPGADSARQGVVPTS